MPRSLLRLSPWFLAACGSTNLGPPVNLDPTAFVEEPVEGGAYLDTQAVRLRGVVSDSNGLDDLASVAWTSSLSGPLGSVDDARPDSDGRTELSVLLEAGTHVISLRVEDRGGLAAVDSVTVTVEAEQQAPRVSISVPGDLHRMYEGESVTFVALVSDVQQEAASLGATWIARNEDSGVEVVIPGGAVNRDGVSTVIWEAEAFGPYRVRLEAIDDEGNVGVDDVVVLVDDPNGVDWDGDGLSVNAGDCDDDDPEAFPGNPESCDLIDNNCDGVVDNKDLDGDGTIDEACIGYVGTAPTGDCDDADKGRFPDAAETCDGLDNDCNDVIDDKDLDGDLHVDRVCTRHDGALPADDCDDGAALVYPGRPESCDLADNDCNTIIDDKDADRDGHVDLACGGYSGSSPKDDCDDADAKVRPGLPESPDGLDNDCDGVRDEGTTLFDDDGDCACESGVCTGSKSSSCTTLVDGDCDDADLSVYPGAVDLPDTSYRDLDCDGLDGDIPTSVFVDPASGKDSNSGLTMAAPVQSLDRAYTVASGAGRSWILVATGALTLSGDFKEGVNVAGGYRTGSTWSRRAGGEPVIAVPAAGKAITGWSKATRWQQVAIEAADNSATGGSSIPLRLSGVSGLTLEAVRVSAGKGGTGASGASGAAGGSGSGGGNGQNGCEDSSGFCDSCSRPGGGGGGSSPAGATGGGGGLPGHGGGSGSTGGSGAGTGAGSGGSGGGASGSGVRGVDGKAGAAGKNGDGGLNTGAFTFGGYTASDGVAGTDGTYGAGGGGGGGGGGGDDWCDSYGGAGGGGGGGGQGGRGGGRGTGGGASVGILLSSSNLSILDTTVETDAGGGGGAGGNGGSAGSGGSGGSGGKGEDDSGPGGGGGNGGSGGAGGHGGGGGGGPSVGVVCIGSSKLTTSGTTTWSIGSGGAGGASSGDRGDPGLRANTDGC